MHLTTDRPNELSVGKRRALLRLILVGFLFGLTTILVAQTLVAAPGNESFLRTWARTDQPVTIGQVNRTWMWGPDEYTGELEESYSESPGGKRTVQYFDKSRMEISDPTADPNADWYVTNGLLVVELITGNMQFGDAVFEQHDPAEVNVAGDADDPTGPTYRSFQAALGTIARETGAAILERIDRQGNVTEDASLVARNVVAEYYVPETDHTVAGPLWAFMNSQGLVYRDGQYLTDTLFPNPFYATGYPITEAYWAEVKVAGTYQDVLMQCFERRCLTYTPGNPEGWQVEAGNVGRHYYTWRYGQDPVDPPAPTATASVTGTATATTTATSTATSTSTGTPAMTATSTATMTATATATATETPITEYAFESLWFGRYESMAPLQGPMGMAVDANDHLWVADTYNHRLVEFDENGVQLSVLGAPGPAPGQFSYPTDLAFSEDGRMFVADQRNHRIQVYDANGAYLYKWGSWGSRNGFFSFPSWVAVHNGTLYVSDRDNHRIQMFNLNGGYQGQFGSYGSGPGQFDKPQQLAFDSQGNLYVVDERHHRVQKFTSTGTFLGQFGVQGGGPGGFKHPHGIAIDDAGYIYIADHYNNRIQKLNPDGSHLATWALPGEGDVFGNFDLPAGLELDNDGNLYVADFANERVQKLTTEGGFLYEIRDASRGTFGTLLDIAVDQHDNVLTLDARKETYDSGSISRFTPAGIPLDALSQTRPNLGQHDSLAGLAVNRETGDIYITDRITNRVQRFSSTWKLLNQWGTPGSDAASLNGPTGIAVDADGIVYVADTENNRIQKYDASGLRLDLWGEVGDGDGQFRQPRGIVVDGERVYVSDSGNDRVQVFDLDGNYLDQFGTSGTAPGQFNDPLGVAVNPDGSVLVVDSGNHRVQIFSPGGTVLGAFGSLGTSFEQFNLPIGIAVDSTGNVYVADLMNDSVKKFRPVS